MAAKANAFCQLAIENVVSTLSIKFAAYKGLGDRYKATCIEEAYTEIDLLIEDVSSGFAESVILEQIFEDIAINEDDKEPLCATIYKTLTTFNPPTSLNLADVSIKVSSKEVEAMKKQVEREALSLKPPGEKDETLLKLLIVGQKNHFPLLTYLVDTYSRYRLLEYGRLYAQLNKIDRDQSKKRTRFIGKKLTKVMDLKVFFQQCHSMQILKHKKKKDANAERALTWYKSSVESFFRRIYSPLKMEPLQFCYKINDNMLTYAEYYVSLLVAVNNIIANSETQLPQQIDFWVIPRAMKQYDPMEDEEEDDDDDKDDDDSDAEDDDEEEKEVIAINNWQQRLKHSKNLVVQNLNSNLANLSRTFFSMHQQVVKGQRSKRMVIIVDRRLEPHKNIENEKNYGVKPEERKEGDKAYAYLPGSSSDIPSGLYLHESLFHLSRIEVLPSEDGKVGENTGAIHGVSFLPNMCLLSVQILEESVVRAYWYINGSASRFFVNDMVNIWPLYFIEREKNGETVPQSTRGIVKLINGPKAKYLPLRDAYFDTFFEQNTKKLSTSYQTKK